MMSCAIRRLRRNATSNRDHNNRYSIFKEEKSKIRPRGQLANDRNSEISRRIRSLPAEEEEQCPTRLRTTKELIMFW